MGAWAWTSGLQIQSKLVSLAALELMKVSLEFAHFFSKAANGKLIIKIPGTKFKDTPANTATYIRTYI